jgi:hypothetical protein
MKNKIDAVKKLTGMFRIWKDFRCKNNDIDGEGKK